MRTVLTCHGCDRDHRNLACHRTCQNVPYHRGHDHLAPCRRGAAHNDHRLLEISLMSVKLVSWYMTHNQAFSYPCTRQELVDAAFALQSNRLGWLFRAT